jgi:hypothetical protein
VSAISPIQANAVGPDWRTFSASAAFESHRLIGWIFWDPAGIANYAALGVPNGAGYYIATRGAPLGTAGNGAVTAAFGSIHPAFVAFGLDTCRRHTTFAATAAARDAAVVAGLHAYVPDIVNGLAAFAKPMWEVADALPGAGRALFAAHRDWPRPENQLLSAWLAVNCIREWRGDTHWAIQIADGLSSTASGILDGAWRSYDDDWLPRSRGADDGALSDAFAELEQRGMATNGAVNAAGIAHRQELEDRLDDLTALPWQLLGIDLTRRFIDIAEPGGGRLMERIDSTAGTKWMPAGRVRQALSSMST